MQIFWPATADGHGWLAANHAWLHYVTLVMIAFGACVAYCTRTADPGSSEHRARWREAQGELGRGRTKGNQASVSFRGKTSACPHISITVVSSHPSAYPFLFVFLPPPHHLPNIGTRAASGYIPTRRHPLPRSSCLCLLRRCGTGVESTSFGVYVCVFCVHVLSLLSLGRRYQLRVFFWRFFLYVRGCLLVHWLYLRFDKSE